MRMVLQGKRYKRCYIPSGGTNTDGKYKTEEKEKHLMIMAENKNQKNYYNTI